MTYRADYRACAFEELLPVTTDTRIVPGIISNVGKLSYFLPVLSRYLMASIAWLLMLPDSVAEARIVNQKLSRGLLCGFSNPAFLCGHAMTVEWQLQDKTEKAYCPEDARRRNQVIHHGSTKYTAQPKPQAKGNDPLNATKRHQGRKVDFHYL